MARTDSLTNFLTDVAESIRQKKETTNVIAPKDFDTEINSIETGADFEINDGSYLFYGNRRSEIAGYLLELCKNLKDTYYMFYNASSVNVPIDLTNHELDNLTNTSSYYYMFYNAQNIPSIKLSSISSVPTSMSYMFNGCHNLTELDIKNLNFASITNLSYMFSNCKSMKIIDLTGIETPKITNVDNMFSYCSSLEDIIFDKFNTSLVTTMVGFLLGCSSLTKLPTGLNQLDFSKVKTANGFFSGCSGFENLDASSLSFPLNTTLVSFFYNCSGAKRIKLPVFASAKITTMNSAFYGCDSLEEIDWNGLDTSSVTNIASLFASESTDTTIEGKMHLDLSNINFSKATTRTTMFRNNKCARTVNLACFDGVTFTSTQLDYWFQKATSLVEIDLTPIHTSTSTTSFRQLFEGCIRLKKIIGLENFVTSGVNNNGYGMYHLFYGCTALEEVDLSGLDTSSLSNNTNSSYIESSGLCGMFQGCESLKNIDISHFVITNKITRLNALFYGCKSLETVSLPDCRNATGINNTYAMFHGCTNLKTINNLDLLPYSSITNFTYMFANSGVEVVNFPVPESIPAGKNYTTQYMFQNCTKLREVDGRIFGPNTRADHHIMRYMFDGCTNLETVDLSNFYNANYMTNICEGMFRNCSSLKNVKLHHVKGHTITATGTYTYGYNSMFEGCTSLEVLDLRYFMQSGIQMSYGTKMFADCRKLRKLDLRGSGYGELGTGSSSWANGVNETFKNCGIDNDSPTIIYTDTSGKQHNLIQAGKKCGLNWSTANVLVVADPEEEVDMT